MLYYLLGYDERLAFGLRGGDDVGQVVFRGRLAELDKVVPGIIEPALDVHKVISTIVFLYRDIAMLKVLGVRDEALSNGAAIQ